MSGGGIVYSTNKDFQVFEDNNTENTNDFILSICFEKKGRKGKGVTIIKGFLGSSSNLKELKRFIQQNLSVGGSIKNNEILIQGRFQKKIIELLNQKGYKTKQVGG